MSQLNRAYFAISNSPGTAGNLTVAAAVSGPYRTLGAAHDGMSFDVSIVDGSAWEVRTGCVYTHGTTTLTRGSLEDSSSGSAINLTSAAVVMVTSTAGAINAASAVLTQADRSASYGFYVEANGTNTQTVTDATWVALHGGTGGVLKTVEYNVGSVWSADSNGRATLPAGRWLLGGCVTMSSMVTGQRLFAAISKNGSVSPAPHRLLARSGPMASNNLVGISGSVIVESDGDDYFRLETFVDGSGTHATAGTAGYTYFWGQYLGPVL